MSTSPQDATLQDLPLEAHWHAYPTHPIHYETVSYHPPRKTLILAFSLFVLALGTSLAAGTQFATTFAQNQAASTAEFVRAFTLFYKNPSALLAGLPFAITLLTILLAHELGHYFACRHHQIHASYPFFIPFPSLIGTLGAFIIMRSPIRTTRALFDVGASGPLTGFLFAIPAFIYGVAHAKIVPGIADSVHAEWLFGTPLLLHVVAFFTHPGISPEHLLLHPIGRAAWVSLFATSLNLLPAGQLDGGHIIRSFNPRLHRFLTNALPFCLLPLGYFFWSSWYIWAGLLFALRFLRIAPITDPISLDPRRRFAAFLCLLVFILCFMPMPITGP